MKKLVLCSVFALAALFSVNVVTAQNPKISKPDQSTVDLSCTYNADGSYTICIEYCRITGLGNASSVEANLTCEATADVSCYNQGQLKQGDPVKSIPGQSSTTSGATKTLQAKNGVLIIQNCEVSVTIQGDCKNTNPNNGFESAVTNVDVSNLYLTLNGQRVSLRNFINQLNSCAVE